MIRKSIIFVLLNCCLLSFAQPGSIDTSFNPSDIGFGYGDGGNGSVFSMLVQPDGKIIIGGLFTSYNGIARNNIARLNSNGSLDNSFNPGAGANGNVQTMLFQSDGKIVIGGDFTSYNGTSSNYIARLNADGSLDTGFNSGTGANNPIYSLSIQSDGKIIIGGNFTYYNNNYIKRIARLNSDGSLDTSFNPGTGVNNGGLVNSTLIQADGKIVIGGYFTNYNGIARSSIARLNSDGSLDTGFNPGTGASTVVSMAIQKDSKIIIGGSFYTYNNIARNNIARLNPDGSLDTTFDPGTGTNNTVKSISIQLDGKIIIGGGFTYYNNSVQNYIARLNPSGSLDTASSGLGADSHVLASSIQTDGKIVIGGGFTSYNGIGRNNIARLNADTSVDISFNSGTGANSTIQTTSIQPDGKIIIGGNFTNFNGTLQNFITRLNSNGSLDTGYNPGTGANGYVYSTSIQSDGKIIIGGNFTYYNGIGRNYIARLNSDGSLDLFFKPGSGANTKVVTTSIQPDGKIIIGGNFTTYNGTSRNYIARLNADGSLDTGFNSGTGANGNVQTLSIQSDGKIVIGGAFTSYNGTTRNYIARLNTDGSLDTGFNPGTGANSNVQTVLIQSDGKIVIGGTFTSYNGTAKNYIARLNTDGSLDTGFNFGIGANGAVQSLSIQSDGKIIIGGNFTICNGTARNYIARLNPDGSLDTSFNPGTGANGAIQTTSIQTDGKIIIGGTFTACDGTGKNRIARINGGGNLSSPTASPQTFCNGATVSNLIATGSNLQWYTSATNGSALPSNTTLATGTYYVSQTVNGSESTRTAVAVTVNQPILPSFTTVAPICSGSVLNPLPTTSNNGVAGIWSPALNNTATTNYTFTPATGQCATTTTLNITVNPGGVTPTFTAVAPICSGSVLNPLSTTSNNGVAGTWSPAPNNTATTTYTFTPATGQCTPTTTLTVTVNPRVTPTFTAITPICPGGLLNPLPTTSNNGVVGTWSPTLNNTTTTTYTFTPATAQCVTTTTLTITVNPRVTPTFTAVAPICPGSLLNPLPTTSNNGVTGTWSPALNNTATTTYTFTPATGQCATMTTLAITVNPRVTPTFTTVAPICSGSVLNPLPTTSNNGIAGTWSPALNNTATTTYTFTPAIVQCAPTTTLTITVNPRVTPTFTAVAPICPGSVLNPLPTTSNNGIIGTWSPTLNNTATTTYAFTPATGQCAATTTLTINVNTIAEGIISTSNTTVCPSTGTILNLSGAVGNITWQKSTNWLSAKPTWSTIANSNITTLPTGNLTVSTAYRTIITAGACSITRSNTNITVVLVATKPIAKSITGNGTSPSGSTKAAALCTNDFSKILIIGSGYYGSIQWQKSTISATSGFTDIIGATEISYIVNNQTVGANFFRAKFTNICGESTYNKALTVYYKDCGTTNTLAITDTETIAPFKVIAYPNPFRESFSLNLTTSSEEKIRVDVYDMLGKLIEQRDIQKSEISTEKIGGNYASGIYNIIVTEGSEIKTLRLIKRDNP